MKPVYLDFEYRNSQNRDMDLLCCALQVEDNKPEVYKLVTEEQRLSFASVLYTLSKDHCFVAFSEAEARCIYQLFEEAEIDFMELLFKKAIKFIDLKIEYRMLINHNHELAYGKQLIKGKEKVTRPPKRKWEIQTEWDKKDLQSNKPETSLASTCYKMLGVLIDTKEKNEVRDLILSNKPLTEAEFNRILYVRHYVLTGLTPKNQ
jgi:hypothetical protein